MEHHLATAATAMLDAWNTTNQVRIDNYSTKNTSLAAKGALTHRLQRRTACNTFAARGLERCLPLGFLDFLSNFR